MHRSIRRFGMPVAVALLVAACTIGGSPSPSIIHVGGSGAPAVLPVIVNSELGVGENHFVFTLVDPTNKPIAAPDRTASVELAPDGGSDAPIKTNGTFVWGIENERGFYVTEVTFPSAGTWKATFTTAAAGGTPDTATLSFTVKDKTSAVAIGQPAPSTKTPTAADVGGDLAQISTDPKPVARFYQISEDQALAQHKPFVLVFATPRFCQSAQCGPTLDHVKAIATKYPNVAFIHYEPYKLQFTNGQLQPVLDANNQLQSTDVTNTWGILTEPWVYVVDAKGIVRGSFVAMFSDEELTSAIDEATKS